MRSRLLAALLLASGLAHAQPTGDGGSPSGRPDAAPEADGAEPLGEALPPGHPPISRGGDGAGDLRLPFEDTADSVEPNRDLPPDTVVVRVVDPGGRAISGQDVALVGLLADESRVRERKTTGSDGRVRFDGLAGGSGRAYRVEVPYRGARYASQPFHLRGEAGTDVTVTRWPVTSSMQQLILLVGQLVVEFGEEGMRCTQHLRLMNYGTETIVPEDGVLRLPLPEGATAFDAEGGMSDLRIWREGGDVIARGAIPPGEMALVYGFQLPIDGSEATIEYGVPFRVMTYEVLVEKAHGARVVVEGMPEATERELGEGRKFLWSRLQRRPGDDPFDRVVVELGGLPGEGVGRWVTLAVVVLLVAMGLFSLRGNASGDALQAEARAVERERLLRLATDLERDHSAGRTKDESAYARRRERIVRRLAELYQTEDSERRRAR